MTIAGIAQQYLIKNGYPGIIWGDLFLLDNIAKLCSHTTLMNAHPLNRHARILDALEHSSYFEKKIIHLKPGYQGRQYCRYFKVIL